MAWDVKYRCEFADRLGIVWKIDIEDETAASTITTLKPTGDPLNFDFLTGGDDIFSSPIHGSTAQIGIYSETDFQWTELYNYGNLAWRISIYYNSTLYWRGYLDSDGYQEPYDGTAYPVILEASDWLGQLKEMLYKYKTTVEDDTYYNGRRLESQIILDILGKIGYTAFTEYVNIYESTMDDSVNDSPFDQIKLDVDVFRDMNCYEVLEHILTKYDACIRQEAGVMIIYRPVELKESTIYGRVFTGALTKTSTSRTTNQFLDRKANITDHRQIDGGDMMIQAPAKKVTINQDYGYKESLIDNKDFDIATWTTAGGFEFWTIVGGYAEPIGYIYLSSKESMGMFQFPSTVVPNPSYYIHQTFGTYLKTTTDVFIISFQYKFIKTSTLAATNKDVCIKLENTAGTRWLTINDDVTCSWANSESYIQFTVADIPAGDGEWTTFSRSVTGIPTDGPYKITLYPSSGTSINLAFKDVRFYATADEITSKRKKRKRRERVIRKRRGLFYGVVEVKKKFYTAYTVHDETEVVEYEWETINNIKGDELENKFLLGDVPDTSTPPSDRDTNIENIIEQFMGSLGRATIQTLAEAAADFVTDHAGDYSPGGVVVTQGTGAHTNDIIFTAATAGVNFTGSTTITNVTTDLSGTVVNTQANVTELVQIDNILITGTSGTADITCNGVTQTMTFSSSIATSIDNFITAWSLDYTAAGVLLSRSGNNLVLTASSTEKYFTGTTTIVNTSPNLSGTVSQTQTYRAAVKRIDTITLTGSIGSANILCDGVTRGVAIIESIVPTSGIWNTRYGSEAKPLIELIGDEMAAQYARPQQFLTLPIIEKGESSILPLIKMIGNFQDILNKYSGVNRIFAVHSGMFDVKEREWDIEMIEIITGNIPPAVNIELGEEAAYTLLLQYANIEYGSDIISFSFTISGLSSSPGGVSFTLSKNSVELFSDELSGITNNVSYSGTIDSGSVAGFEDVYLIELKAES